MFRFALVLAGVITALSLGWASAEAGGRQAKRRHTERVVRDCTPLNGRYGYYGNPWCDTGSSRPPDIEFRERARRNTGVGKLGHIRPTYFRASSLSPITSWPPSEAAIQGRKFQPGHDGMATLPEIAQAKPFGALINSRPS